jgi:nitrile hydratase subunit beta
MNGIHDMGGMHGMGPIQIEKNEPVFHTEWEGRIYAITLALRDARFNIDVSRHGVELIPPADYLRMSYYERWLSSRVESLVRLGIVTREEIESGHAAPDSKKATPALSAARAAETALIRGNFSRPESKAVARFKVGQRVRARNINPVGHTRLPRYARSKTGVVARHHGIFVFPDTNAQLQGEQPQHLYSIRFAARELWGETASSHDSVYIDMWDSYLEHA